MERERGIDYFHARRSTVKRVSLFDSNDSGSLASGRKDRRRRASPQGEWKWTGFGAFPRIVLL